jgi:hypothetical protein
MRRFLATLPIALGLLLAIAPVSHATTIYTQDHNLNDFTSGMNYGTFIAAPFGDLGGTVPYTPTTANVDAGLRVYGTDGSQPVIVQFNSATSFIRVFANIDHPGSAYDGFQYSIFGSNDGVTYTSLFDATTVIGSGEPFTLGTFTGTAPTTVNNYIQTCPPDLGCGPAGSVGYIADFNFASA